LAVRTKNALTISLTYNIHHGVLCLLRVYALYGRSRRILALLLSVGMGSIITTLVSRFLLTLSMHVPTSVKVSFFLVHYYSGGETVTVVPTFRGCSRYTQDMEYVADPGL
jgi:hypothetical protein